MAVVSLEERRARNGAKTARATDAPDLVRWLDIAHEAWEDAESEFGVRPTGRAVPDSIRDVLLHGRFEAEEASRRFRGGCLSPREAEGLLAVLADACAYGTSVVGGAWRRETGEGPRRERLAATRRCVERAERAVNEAIRAFGGRSVSRDARRMP